MSAAQETATVHPLRRDDQSLTYQAICEFADKHAEDDATSVARQMVGKMTKAQLVQSATAYIAATVDGHRRSVAWAAEARATRARAEAEQEAAAHARRERRREADERRERDGTVMQQILLSPDFISGLREMLDNYADSIRLEVTAELLATSFKLGDGTAVTWGEATVEQHEQRVAMLTKSVAGTLETAGRHTAAIRMIREAEATCLQDLAA